MESKLKIVGEMPSPFSEQRKKFWLEALALPLQWRELASEEILDPASLLKDLEFDALLLDAGSSDSLLQQSTHTPAEVREAGMADSLVREGSRQWLRCFLKEALKTWILRKAPQLDTHSLCYVTGAGSMARMAASVAIQIGFRQLVMISREREKILQNVEAMKKLFFDLDIRILHENELTLQPNNGSLLINTLTPEEGGEVFEDLTYLNFLKIDGLVVDIPFSTKKNALLEEAEHVKLLSVAGRSLWGLRDELFLRHLLGDGILKLSEDQYQEQWASFLEKQT